MRIFDNAILRIIVKRSFFALVLVLVVSALTFVFVALTPGDAARSIVGPQGSSSDYQRVREELRLDEPITNQYWHWLSNAAQGDFGSSLFSSEPVADALSARVPTTASLIFGALIVSVLIGVAIGVLSAVRGGIAARFVDALALTGFALPSFFVGTVLITIFAVDLGWFPATGYVDFADSPEEWLASIVLPVTALAIGGIAAIAKQSREAMLDAMASPHVRIAWASGVSPRSIVFRHAFRNAAIPIVTVVGWLFVSLLGGTVFVESVFALPGLGDLAVDAALRHDVPVIQGVVIYFTVIVVLVNLVVDLAYLWLDPRVRVQ